MAGVKKTLVFIFVLIGMTGGLMYAQDKTSPLVSPAPAVLQTYPEQKKPQEIVVSEPVTLSIPKLNVNTSVESVGEDREGKMDVPKDVYNVGWYNLGFEPGEKGSAVVAGHLDTVTGSPAVFYYIDNLTPGDEVIVTDKNGIQLTFIVTHNQTYPFDQVPLQEVFAPTDKPRLNLITCTGEWNIGTRNYSNRLVVYTELKSS